VATARSHLNQMWLQEKSEMNKDSFAMFELYADRGFPDPYLFDADDVIELFLNRYASKQIGMEYIGRDGKPGFAWPPLSDHDANHAHFLGARRRAAHRTLLQHTLSIDCESIDCEPSPCVAGDTELIQEVCDSLGELMEDEVEGSDDHDGDDQMSVDDAASSSSAAVSEDEDAHSVELAPDKNLKAKPADFSVGELLRAHVITIKQPFASAIILGIKTNEYRTWELPIPVEGGRWLALHVAASVGIPSELVGYSNEIKKSWPNMPHLSELPRSCILGWMHISSCTQGHTEKQLPSDMFAWHIDNIYALEVPLIDIKGAQGLWKLPEESIELLKASEFKTSKFVMKQAVLAVEPVQGNISWGATSTVQDDIIEIDLDDDESKLFGDNTKCKPLAQVTLKGESSGVEKWMYEGDITVENSEQSCLPNAGVPVMHDVFGQGIFIRRGMLQALLIRFDKLDPPNPRSVTAGHVYVLKEPPVPELLTINAPPLVSDSLTEAAAVAAAATGEDACACAGSPGTGAAAAAAAVSGSLSPPSPKSVSPPLANTMGDADQFMEEHVEAFTADGTEELDVPAKPTEPAKPAKPAHPISVGQYVVCDLLTDDLQSSISGYVIDNCGNESVVVVTDPAVDDEEDDRRTFKMDTKDWRIRCCDDMQPLFARLDPLHIFSERGGFIQVDTKSKVEMSLNGNGTYPLLGAYCTSAMGAAARTSLGANMVTLVSHIQIGSENVKVGDVVGVHSSKGNDIESLAIVTFIVIPFSMEGDFDPKQAKLLALRVKAQGRYMQAKACNVLSPRGTALSVKKGAWDFMTFAISESARNLMVIDPVQYFNNKISRSKALTLFFGDHILDQMNSAIYYSMTPFHAVRDKWSAMNTIQLILNYPIDVSVYDNVTGDATASNCSHILTMGMASVSEVIAKKYATLGTEIKASTKVEAFEVSLLHCTRIHAHCTRIHVACSCPHLITHYISCA
jgi:hypothetical protein